MNRFTSRFTEWSVGLLLVAGGCVGPNYSAPQTTLPDRWQQDLRYGLSSKPRPSDYWREFKDPILTTLIERAGKGNYDLQSAWWNLQQARARVGVVEGEFFPTVDADSSFSRSRVSKYGPSAPAPVQNPKTKVITYPRPDTLNLTTVGTTAVWEADVFGRIRRASESARASEQASRENYYDVMVILDGDIATAYLEARTIQKKLAIAASNIASQRKMLKLAQVRHDSGLVPALDVAQARSNLANTEASVPSQQADLRRALNRLDVLLGERPGTVARSLVKEAPLPRVPARIAMGLPADLVRRRPDIRRAERELAAQTALIGVATAQLYPSFTLSGALHYEAIDAADIGRAYSAAYSFGPQMTWNIFDGNRIRSQIKVEEAATQRALAIYQQTVLRALEEVENAANDYVQELERQEKLTVSVQSLMESVKLVEEQYRTGLTDFQNVLDMQRSVFVQQDNLAASEGLALINLVRLYRATGGGWETDNITQADKKETQTKTK